MTKTPPEFGKVRSILWPIHSYELKKLVPMVLLFFLILFNYTILRDTKDALVVTAPGDKADFVPRYFAPSYGIPEDPVTGSNHCALIPFWSKKLGKQKLVAHQISKRGGELRCEELQNQVLVSGQATLYLEGEIII